MALNWDKLSKLRRDYAKPKFAFGEVTRQLKKKPNDPYLLAWQADTSLRYGAFNGPAISQILVKLFDRQPPITDLHLLSYIYCIQVDLIRSTNVGDPKTLRDPTAGEGVIKAWQNGAKSLSNRIARLELWTGLFVTAMQEDCWDDVRTALNQAAKEGPKFRRRLYFSTVFANILSSEIHRKIAEESKQPLSKIAEIPGQLAFKQMIKAFDNVTKSPEDPIQVQDWRDLKFMASVCGHNKDYKELLMRWDNAPPALGKILDTYCEDVVLMKLDILRDNGQWRDLGTMCEQVLTEIADSKRGSDELTFNQLSERSWKIWGYIIEAAKHCEQHEQTETDRIKSVLDDKFKQNGKSIFGGRPGMLTQMALTDAVKRPLLSLCKAFWLEQHHIRGCFHDLRKFVVQLNPSDQEQFHSYIISTTSDMTSDPEFSEQNEKLFKRWLQAEVNVLKFNYFLTIAKPRNPLPETLSAFISSAIRLCKIASRLDDADSCHDAGILAIESLGIIRSLENERPRNEENAWSFLEDRVFLWQAAFLARHLTAGENGRQNRALVLQSIGLQLDLGLAAIAFEQYQHVRVKEMLHDTLSYTLLTRISLLHPFDSKSPKKIYPDDELAKVIGSMEKMEAKTGEILYKDMQKFEYDQASSLLDFKRQLRSSFTKHICVIERRRIARFKNETVDESLDLDLNTFIDIADNRDFNYAQNYRYAQNEPIRRDGIQSHANYPNMSWLRQYYCDHDAACQIMFKDPPNLKSEGRLQLLSRNIDEVSNEEIAEGQLSSEQGLNYLWKVLQNLARGLTGTNPHTEGPWSEIPRLLTEARDEIASLQNQVQGIAVPQMTSSTQKAEVVLPLSSGVRYLFLYLEVAQVCWKIVELADEKRVKRDPKFVNRLDVKVIQEIRESLEKTYSGVQAIAKGWIDFARQHGVAVIKAKVKFGPTGESLKEMLSDQDIDFYARESIDSLIDTISGVLKVKLKR